MYHPSLSEFRSLAQKGNIIPVYKEIAADLETPVSAFLKVCGDGPDSFLLESVEKGERMGRYSFLGTDPMQVYTSFGSKGKIRYREGITTEGEGSPYQVLEQLMTNWVEVSTPGHPPFTGGALGFFGYETVHSIEEKVPNSKPNDLNLPDAYFMVADTLLAFDHVKHKLIIIANAHVQNPKGDLSAPYEEVKQKIEGVIKKLSKPLVVRELVLQEVSDNQPYVASNLSQDQFEKMVEKGKEYIKSGDIFQVVLSQRLSAPLKTDPFTLYRTLRMVNPSPYMFYINGGDFQLVGSSPEVMVKLENGMATLRPIAGTRPRGKDLLEDEKTSAELLADEKERAEHLMLLDLGRNDLGRVCKKGSVRATERFAIEKYSHVLHIVSNVTGELEKGKNAFDLFKACFPAGTVSGAPKVRAMEIIHELEPTRRGPYAGAVGYFSFSGDMNTGIIIRTMVIKDKQVYVQAGAGIVADSVPSAEYQETLNKARALLKTLKIIQTKE